MAFTEPVGAYFAHFQHTATVAVTGATILGYLNETPFDIDGSGFRPDVETGISPEFHAPRSSWDAGGARTGDVLVINDQRYRVLTDPRDPVVVRIRLQRVA